MLRVALHYTPASFENVKKYVEIKTRELYGNAHQLVHLWVQHPKKNKKKKGERVGYNAH